MSTSPWVRQKVCLHGAAYQRIRPIIMSQNSRRVRRHGFRSVIARDAGSADRFYHDMYVPHVQERFGRDSCLRSRREIVSAIERGFVLQVRDRDRWVAGMACYRRGREVVNLAVGVAGDHLHNLQRGALAAGYYFLLLWAEDHGLDEVDLMRSRPHASDGVYEHKRRWGARAGLDSWPHTAIAMYLPEGQPLHEPLRRQLVRDGEAFVELGELVEG